MSTTSPAAVTTTTTPSTTVEDLDFRRFRSTGVVGHTLAADLTVSMSFDGDLISLMLDCNRVFTTVRLDHGVLTPITGVATTAVGCPPGKGEHDRWMAELLMAGPRLDLSGEQLTLTTPSATVTFQEQPYPFPGCRHLLSAVYHVEDHRADLPGFVAALRAVDLSSAPAGVASALTAEVDRLAAQVGTGTPWGTEGLVEVLNPACEINLGGSPVVGTA